MKTTISIIILTYRPNSILLRSLDKLSNICEANVYDIEVIIINTISQTKIEDIIKKDNYLFQLKIINIKKSEFNFGLTRNMGVENAKGEYVIFLSGDACPISMNFINYFIGDLRKKNRVAVFGKEIAPKQAPKGYLYNEHAVWFTQYEKYFDDKKRVIFNKKMMIKSKNPNDKVFWYSLSNVFSCYKRNFLKKYPFDAIYHGEDVMMGKLILEKGFEKVFDSRCLVEHFHSSMKDFFIRSIHTWYFRIFILKSGINIKIQEKINFSKDNNFKLNIFKIYIFYILKALILAAVFSIKLKQMILTRLIKEKRTKYIKKYI